MCLNVKAFNTYLIYKKEFYSFCQIPKKGENKERFFKIYSKTRTWSCGPPPVVDSPLGGLPDSKLPVGPLPGPAEPGERVQACLAPRPLRLSCVTLVSAPRSPAGLF